MIPGSNNKGSRSSGTNQNSIIKTAIANVDEIFRLLVDSVTDYAIFALDTEGHVLTWNTGAERLKGYTADQIIGQHFSRFYTPEDVARQHPQNELKIAVATGKYEEEGWRVRRDGSRFWANVVINKLVDKQGNFIGFAKVTRDLTERKRADARLRESEERSRLMIEGVKDYAIFLLDPDGLVATWNEGARRIKQYEANEIIGQHFSKFYPEIDIKNKKPQHELEVVTAVGRFEDEGWRLKKDGSLFWANVIITAIRDRDGKLIGFSKVTRDLTERKQQEEKLRRANEDLEKRVAERTQELVRLTERLEASVRSRDEFLSIASHELKTPLTSLKLQAQMRIREVSRDPRSKPSSEFAEKMARNDVKQINRLTRLVDDMLDITRIGSGNLKIERSFVDLSALVRDVMARLNPEIEALGYKVSTDAPVPVNGSWDSFRMEQVLTNLVNNAMKYGNHSPIEVSVSKNSAKARLTVVDRGPGIKKEDQEKIFEQFERAAPASGVSGLGLGLYIVRKIVEAQNGRVWVESEIGQGSRFIVELPL